MKKRRILLGLALAAAAVFSLSACDEKAPTDPEPEVVVTPPAEGDGDGEVVDDTKIKMNGTEYDTIKAALAAVPTDKTDTYTITIPKGTYNEDGLAYNGKATIHIKGNTTTKYGADVIIRGHGSDMNTEKGRSLIAIQGSGDIILENVTLESDWTRTGANKKDVQSEVLGTDTTGKTVAYNCAFKSNQDTLRTISKAWFYGCYIEGDVDFIWMERAGVVALYEKCEIVSIYDSSTYASHETIVAAPRMTKASKIGKGLVIYNSTVKESAEAKAQGQKTYLARNLGSSDCYDQVAYINTDCSDIEASVWKNTQAATDHPKTAIGWKMDQATATSLNYAGNDDILDADTVSKEFNGRKAILNRVYNLNKQKYEKSSDIWDIDKLITDNNFQVEADNSSNTVAGEVEAEITTYKFDDSMDVSAIVSGFKKHSTSASYTGGSGSTITVPVTGKSYVTVYGWYSGTVEATAGTQGEGVMLFNNGNTNSEVENTYVVYDENATEVVLTAKSTTYITKVVVEKDSTIQNKAVTGLTVTADKSTYTVGVPVTLSAKTTPADATNKNVEWSSSDETVATVNEYTGVVTFKKAGEVTFTATARDGSGVTGTLDCEVENGDWTMAEWYTVDNQTADYTKETNATNIKYFTPSGYAALKQTYTFKNLAGDDIQTAYGIKLNSSGKLTISTTAAATLTIVIAPDTKDTSNTVKPKVVCGSTTATDISTVENGDLTTYTYRLPSAGTWEISRGDAAEDNPILYAKVVYDAVWDFQHGTPGTISSTNIATGNNNGTVASNVNGVALTVDATTGKLQARSSDAQFNGGAIIKVPVKYAGSVLTVVSYPGYHNYSVAGTDVTSDTYEYTVTAADVTAGYVSITASSSDSYLYSISLTNPR